MGYRYLRYIPYAIISAISLSANAQVAADYRISLIGNGSTGDFAPYMIGSWNHGKTTQKGNALIDAGVWRNLDQGKRFSWGFGIEGLTGYSSENDYSRWNENAQSWETNRIGPAAAWIQQLYGELKYRGVFLTAGMKEHESALLNSRLSSGDFIESGNSRPIPEVRAGFIDFQDIPFTNGWVQIQGEISYGKLTDNDYLLNHYNHYNYHITENVLYTYKRAYFRTKPTERLSVTAGAQCAGQFGGTAYYYNRGKLEATDHHPAKIKDFWEMFIPSLNNGDDFVLGNHIGSWDFKAAYRLRNNSEVMFYFQWPWEDGSAMAKRNKWDGIWGIEYKSASRGIVNGAVIEYIDFRDQSGPLHWAPGDYPGTTITSEATGGDDYYNNSYYNAYAHYGMSIGTPFLMSPHYNTDGYPGYVHTRTNGFHAGLNGSLGNDVDYRILLSYQKAWGAGRQPVSKALDNTSMLFESSWNASALIKGLSVKGQISFDTGSLRGNNFGAALAVTYRGSFNITRR